MLKTIPTAEPGPTQAAPPPQLNWRVKTGLVLFLISLVWPLFIPILPLLGVSAAVTATIAGLMFGAAELLFLAAVAIAGKEGFAYIKAQVFGVLKVYGPPQRVGRTRYRIGLIMFVLPLLFGFLSPYLGQYLPGLVAYHWIYALVFDVVLVASLFVLGGDFWDKLRALFLHSATVVMPEKKAADKPAH